MIRLAILLCGVGVLVAARAEAAGVQPTGSAVPVQAVASQPPRPQPFSFVGNLFRRPGEAQSDPVSILPPLSGLQPAAVAPTHVVVVPMPRLRPAYQPATGQVASTEAAQPPAVRQIVPEIDQSTTASVAPPPQEREEEPAVSQPPASAPPAAAVPAPEAAPVVAAPPAAAGPDRDDLLGDPSATFVQSASDSDPRLPPPTQAGAPLPRTAAARSAQPPAPVLTGQPYEVVRTLQAVQDQLAQGVADALPVQQTLRIAIERAFASAGPEVWQERRNDLAAVTYVLSGGSPEVLRRLARLVPPPPIDLKLVAGVLAYAEGREKEAGELLNGIDPLDLPPSMGAQLAIAQSALAVRTDPPKAMRLLGIARLVAPGTLAEEAAIRRQIYIADQLKDDKAVQSLARQYLDRFRHSVYAGNFRSRFAAALSHMDFVNDEAQFARLDDMLASVEPAARLQLYLTVALASAIKSRTIAARLASERALTLADPLSSEQARAKLYHVAALVASAKTFGAAVSEYTSIDRGLLAASDQALLDVVGVTIANLKTATDRPSGATKVASAAAEPETPLMKRAGETLKAIDTLLAAAR